MGENIYPIDYLVSFISDGKILIVISFGIPLTTTEPHYFVHSFYPADIKCGVLQGVI